jgi:uncharacterized RDD family membrane protein YckC
MVEAKPINAGVTRALQGAGFGIRLLARVIDLAVTLFVASFMLLLVTHVINVIAFMAGDTQQVFVQQFMLDDSPTEFMMEIFAYVAYHAVAEQISGSTLGKWITGLVVVQEDGTPIRLKQGIGRNLWFYFESMMYGLPAVQSMYKSPRRQRHGDVWNRTMVVRRRALPAGRRPSAGMFLVGLSAALTVFAVISILGNLARIL